MKKIFSWMFMFVFLVLAVMSGSLANADPGDLFVQVDFDNDGASILRVAPDGTLSEWVSHADIVSATGETGADFADTGLVVAADGTIYFTEDFSDDILMVSPAGTVSVFVDSSAVDAIPGLDRPDYDNGMTLGQDGNLYVADEDNDCVIRVAIPSGTVSVAVTEAQIIAVTGEVDADLDGGIARDADGNLYITDDDGDTDDSYLIKVAPNGTTSILVTEADVMAVTGNPEADLDVAIALDGDLFVLDDGGWDDANNWSNFDAVLRVDTNTGAVSLVAGAAAIFAVTGAGNDAREGVDLEGGLAIDNNGVLFIGDDGNLDEDPYTNYANIVRITQAGVVSLFVSDNDLSTFYSPLYPNVDLQLRGSMAFQPSEDAIPTLSEWGMIIFSLLIACSAIFFINRRSRMEDLT